MRGVARRPDGVRGGRVPRLPRAAPAGRRFGSLSRHVHRRARDGRDDRRLGAASVTRDLSVRIGSLELRNPVLVASGIIGYGREYERLVSLEEIGGIVTKTVTRRARAGNPP